MIFIIPIKDWPKEDLIREVLHFQELNSLSLQRKENLPVLPNIDYFANIEPYESCVGGDYLHILNFAEFKLEKRIAQARTEGNVILAAKLEGNREKFGVLIADAAGHSVSDSATTNYLDGAFMMAVISALTYKGEITAEPFEMLNTVFYNRSTPDYLRTKPHMTLVYGEFSNDGTFRYLNAGHPPPLVFSREYDRFVALDDSCTQSSTSLGVFPSEYHADIKHFQRAVMTKGQYPINHIKLLGLGDILLLHTDGLLEREDETSISIDQLEQILRSVKDKPAKKIYRTIVKEVTRYSPFQDDATLVVVKKAA